MTRAVEVVCEEAGLPGIHHYGCIPSVPSIPLRRALEVWYIHVSEALSHADLLIVLLFNK